MKINGKEVILVSKCGKAHMKAGRQSRIFKNWIKSLDRHITLHSIEITAVDFHSSTPSAQGVLFVRLLVQIEGMDYKQVVELRGNTAAMLVNLTCKEDGKVYTVLTQQQRLPTGKHSFVEVPAGMVDHGTFVGAASREIREELGLKFKSSRLIDISGMPKGTSGIYLSPGLLDESCRFYLAEKKVSRKYLEWLEGQTHGVLHEGEQIKLTIIPIDDIPKVSQDAKTLLALALYRSYKEKR